MRKPTETQKFKFLVIPPPICMLTFYYTALSYNMGLGILKEHRVIAKRSTKGWPKKYGVALREGGRCS